MQTAQGAGVFLRPLQPDDAPALKLLHQQLFPLDYDDGFYTSATQGLDGVVAWAALAPLPSLTCLNVDASDIAPQLVPPASPAGQAELLAGFVTARGFPALYADPNDRRLLGLDGQAHDRERLLYVLTLGVAPPYQRRGLARRLLERALRHAAQAACRAVYLHVAAFNQAALAFYRAAGFRQLATLPGFYSIRRAGAAWTGRQPLPGCTSYDACLFGCTIAPPSPTPWDAASLALQPLTAVIGSLNACLPSWSGQARRKVPATEAAGGEQRAAPTRELDLEAQQAQQQLKQQQLEQQHSQQQAQQQAQAGAAGVAAGGSYRHPPGGPFTQQPSEPCSSDPDGHPPDWLRTLFVRR